MITVLLSLFLSCTYFQASHCAESLLEESVDLRCVHGGQQVPIIACIPASPCVTTTCNFVTTATLATPSLSFNSSVTVPGPSATYTSLSISGTLTANQVCASNVLAANMNSLFLQSDYYAKMSNYQILRSDATIFGTFGNELVITATDGAVGNGFGRSVAISGDGSIIVAGALVSGNTYIYRRQFNTWALLQEINFPGGAVSSVAISADASTIAVTDGIADIVHLYQYNATLDQYVPVQSIPGLTGISVSLSATGQYLVAAQNSAVPAQALVYLRNDTCAGRGSVWTLQQALTPLSASAALGLHAVISADNSTIALGVTDGASSSPDKVHMFTRSGTQWSLVQTLTASDGVNNDGFGESVSLSSNGQYLLVGASRNGSGRAYEFVYRGGTTLWNQENEFFPPAGVAAGFGYQASLSADGTVGAISAEDTLDTLGTGTVFVVLRSPDNNWTMPSHFSGHSSAAELGLSVAVSPDGAFIVAGAPALSDVVAGSISIFRPVSAIIPADTIITGSLCVNVNMIVNADVLVTGSVFIQGSIITGGTVPCSTPSDIRLKENIKPLPAQEAFKRLHYLRPVTFAWANPEEHPGESDPSAGLIAQDVEHYFPRWIRRGQATGRDAQLVSAQDPARLIEITPELYAYLVACIKGLDESNEYKDKLMELYKAHRPCSS